MDISLRYYLQARSNYVLGTPIVIAFSIKSFCSTDVWILNWHTPLEGIKGKIFEVTCDGIEIPYEGRLVKRGNPQRKDYILLRPGASAQAEFDLSQVYSLRECNECRLKFKGRIHDVVLDEQQVARAVDQHVGVDVPGDPVSFRIER